MTCKNTNTVSGGTLADYLGMREAEEYDGTTRWPLIGDEVILPNWPEITERMKQEAAALNEEQEKIRRLRERADAVARETHARWKIDPNATDRREKFSLMIEVLERELARVPRVAVLRDAVNALGAQKHRASLEAVEAVVEKCRKELGLAPGERVPLEFLQSKAAWWRARRAIFHHTDSGHDWKLTGAVMAGENLLAHARAMLTGEEKRIAALAARRSEPPATEAPDPRIVARDEHLRQIDELLQNTT
jgi:hypothetical protein